MLLSFERPIVGAFAFVIPGATLLLLTGLVQAVLPESKNMSKRIIGFPRNLGGPVVSSANSRLELPGYQLQASAVGARPPRSEKNECQPRYRQVKATKRGGMDGRKSQRLDSTVEAGELASEDPVEESEASAGRLNRGKHAEHIEVPYHVTVTCLNSFGDRFGGWRTCQSRNRMR